METAEKENNDNISSTKEETKKDENQLQQKIILPQIQNQRSPNIPSSSYNRKLKSSKSQKDLWDNNQSNKWKLNNNNNTEKEKLMLAKQTLSRLITKIKDINYSYKKLLIEKEENLNIIRQAISANDYTYSENLYKKVEKVLEESINKKLNNNNNQNIPESKITQISENKNNEEQKQENENKNNEDQKQKNENKNNEDINNENNKENDKENNNEKDKMENKDEKNENIEKKENENNDNDKNYNNEINGEINKENNENNEENNINSNNDQGVKHRHNYSMETRGEDNNVKNNSINNNINNNSSILQNNADEDNSIKELNDELNKYEIENGLFEKSVVSSKYYNLLKAKAELSTLKHKMIIIKQIINLKEEEIAEIRNRAKMKNIIFQSNLLGRNISELHKIKTRNKQMEEISVSKNAQYENLQKKLEYYKKLKDTSSVESKNSNENYNSIKNECDKKKELCRNLEEKHSNLKYKLNTLRQRDFKKTMALKIMKEKIAQISTIKETIDNQKKTISEKDKELNELKENLNTKLKEYEESSVKRNNGFDEMNKCERQLNYKISRQKNEFNKARNEIRNIDKLIIKEIEIYGELNRNNQDAVHTMYNKKGKDNKEFMNFLIEEEKNQEKKGEDEKKESIKKYSMSNKFTYNFISKIKKNENGNKRKKTKKNEILPLLEDKLVY